MASGTIKRPNVKSAMGLNGYHGLYVDYWKDGHTVMVRITGTLDKDLTLSGLNIATEAQFNDWGIITPVNWCLCAQDFNNSSYTLKLYSDGTNMVLQPYPNAISANTNINVKFMYVTTQ